MNPPPPAPRPVPARRRESGQALVIIAASFIGLAAFIGLAIDLGILIVNQAHLRRAVDSAAIAAAGQLREGQDFRKIGQFAAQFIRLNNVDVATVVVQQCLRDPISGVININQYTTAPTETVQLLALADVDPRIQAVCNTSTPRKQIRVEAEVDVRFSFLPIIGLFGTTIQAEAVSEAASLDVVLVIATGETMGQTTYPRSSCFGRDVNSDVCTGTFDPNVSPACNANAGPEFTNMPEDDPLQHIPADPSVPAKCRPLWDAKQAAKRLVDTLYAGFDRVAVVGYDTYAQIYEIGSQALSLNLGQRATASTDSTGAYAAIDSMTLRNTPLLPADYGQFSPLNIACVSGSPTDAACFEPDPDNAVASNCAGCGLRVATNILKNTGRPESLWVIVFLSDGYTNMTDVGDDFVPARAGNVLEIMGSDFDEVSYPNGFCPGAVGENAGEYGERIWTSPICLQGNYDIDENGAVEGLEPFTINPRIRFCGPYHPGGAGTCPPGSIYVGDSGYTDVYTFTMPSGITYTGVTTPFIYNAYDYALDMVDFAALTTRCPEGVAEATCNGGALQAGGLANRYNANEQKGKPPEAGGNNLAGTNIVIYSIGLGPEVIASSRQGETLLRYMAAVADDGDRVTDPCTGIPSSANCGNYYFAPDPTALGPVFEDIARRIFTRITR